MKIHRILPCSLLYLTGLVGMASAETLEEAMISAYSGNSGMEAQRSALRALNEGVPQALAGRRPTANAQTNWGIRHQESDRILSTTNPASVSINLNQPLYTGGIVDGRVNRAEANIRRGRATLTGTEQTILSNAISAFMNVLRDQEVVQLNQSNVNVLEKQLQAAKDRFEVGETTRTDVAQAEARLARSISDFTRSEGQLASSRANYLQVVGHPADNLILPETMPEVPLSVEEALDISLVENPNVLAAYSGEDVANWDVQIAKRQLNPRLDVTGSAQFSDNALRPGARSEDYAITGRLSIPLYQGGSVYSQVRQAQQTRGQRRLETLDTRRQVEEGVRISWANLTTARAVIQSSNEQVRAAEIALEGVQQEFLVGARTTLDVLDAEQELLDARVALVTAQRDEFVAVYEVLSAIGRLRIANLGLGVDEYDPRSHYRLVRAKWFGFSPPSTR